MGMACLPAAPCCKQQCHSKQRSMNITAQQRNTAHRPQQAHAASPTNLGLSASQPLLGHVERLALGGKHLLANACMFLQRLRQEAAPTCLTLHTLPLWTHNAMPPYPSHAQNHAVSGITLRLIASGTGHSSRTCTCTSRGGSLWARTSINQQPPVNQSRHGTQWPHSTQQHRKQQDMF